MRTLDSRCAVVTGAGRGIGRAIALRLAAEGAAVVVNDLEASPAEEVAARIEKAASVLGPERIRFVHPDCGFWMLKRSVSDRKIAALAEGRDLYLGI